MSCPICDDTGWKPVVVDGHRRMARCDCWRDGLAGKMLAEARIEPRYRGCELENFVTYPNEGLLRAFERAVVFADAFPVVDKGLCLVGSHGIGKTHLAVGVLKRAIRRTAARGLFYDTTDLLRLIRSTYDRDVRIAEMDILRPVMDAELLVLDDIGKDKNSEWVEETMNLIVNTRYNRRLPTIFTSNYEDNPDHEELDSLRVRLGTRIHSRLHEMCEFLEFDGADYRHLPPNGGVDDLVALWKVAPSKKGLPSGRGKTQLKARLREGRDAHAELKWPGGRAGS